MRVVCAKLYVAEAGRACRLHVKCGSDAGPRAFWTVKREPLAQIETLLPLSCATVDSGAEGEAHSTD